MGLDPLSTSGGRRERGVLADNTAEMPLVTVITAVFNDSKYLASCLDSVSSQDYPNIEHLVLDGGSTDGTVDVLRQHDHTIAYWQSEPDSGIYDAWNKGVRAARGEWICFLGADDEFLPGAISAYMKLAANNPHAEYMSSTIRWVHSSGYQKRFGTAWTWNQFSQWMNTAQAGSMHRRCLYDRVGFYDTSYRSSADYELLLRARSTLKAAFMPIDTVVMRSGGVSDSAVALLETKRAKIATGGRNGLLAGIEFQIARLKLILRSVQPFSKDPIK